MPWYKTGTVAVTLNNGIVIGTGTTFAANARVGDAFRGPDGGWYEITNIVSDTTLSISPDYQGVSNIAGGYALAPLQGYVKSSADQLRSLVNQFGATFAALGTSGTAAGIKTALGLDSTNGIGEGNFNLYFTQPRVLATPLTGFVTTTNAAVVATDSVVVAAGKMQAQITATNSAIAAANISIGGKAAKGANSDITSLNGLTAALSIAQGGTGRNDGLAWGNLKGPISTQTDLQTVLDTKSGLGIGQTWQNMTASRALATTYTNTSGKPIQIVALAGPTPGINTTLTTNVQGVGVSGNYSASANMYISSTPVIVPQGATYSIAVNATTSLIGWVELR